MGLLSKDAQEARNKDIIRFSEHHARQTSAKNTMENFFNDLLISSDPLISSLRKQIEKKTIPHVTK